ncbi:MAG: tRNA pseudouridine(38-40) synthase TruA [Ruminococcaceae bacterium]|nr:tRNA pseudouridine(38-40) synthase TruA [Oscillospiraceae bacterium]
MRLQLTLRYDGTAFHGWQVQPGVRTVQETLQDAIEAVTGVRSGVIGCSRTDAGVHADRFCCTFDTDSPLRGNKLCSALNFHLPEDMAVTEAIERPADFHPRYQALGKRYVYRIWNGAQRHPIYARYALHRNRPLDVDALHAAAAAYVGTHDFAGFCSAGSDVQGTVRTVTRCTVTRQGDMVLFTVEADGFLYNMVRIMVGTLLDIADGRLAAADLPAILASADRARAGATAPAHGLCLQEVFYDERS